METQKRGRRKRKRGKKIETKAGGTIDGDDGGGWLGAATDNDLGRKLSLTTSSKDYAGNLGLPEKVAQRKYETTGQFFRRLDRLVAKARVEASLESRFDVSLGKREENEKFKKAKRRSSKLLDSDKIMLESSRKYKDRRRKRYGR